MDKLVPLNFKWCCKKTDGRDFLKIWDKDSEESIKFDDLIVGMFMDKLVPPQDL